LHGVALIQTEAGGGAMEGTEGKLFIGKAQAATVALEVMADGFARHGDALSPDAREVVLAFFERIGERGENERLGLHGGEATRGFQGGVEGVPNVGRERRGNTSRPTDRIPVGVADDLSPAKGKQTVEGDTQAEAGKDEGVIATPEGSTVAAQIAKEGGNLPPAEEDGASIAADPEAGDRGGRVEIGRAMGVDAALATPAVEVGDEADDIVDLTGGVVAVEHPGDMGFDVGLGDVPRHFAALLEEAAPGEEGYIAGFGTVGAAAFI